MFSRKRTLISHILKSPIEHIDTNIQVSGWLDSIRIQGANSLAFAIINDGSCLQSLQIIINIDNENDTFDDILNRGTKGISITVEGKLIPSPAKGQEVELVANSIKIYGDVDGKEYPLSGKKLSLEHIRKFKFISELIPI